MPAVVQLDRLPRPQCGQHEEVWNHGDRQDDSHRPRDVTSTEATARAIRDDPIFRNSLSDFGQNK